MRVLIVGCGRVGATLATSLADDGHDVVVVDRDPEAFANLGATFNGMTVTGAGIDQDVLKEAGIDGTDAFAAVTASDSSNLMAAQVAQRMFGVKRVVARINEPRNEAMFRDLGVPGVCPTDLGASSIRSMLLTVGIQTQYSVGAGEVVIADAIVGPAQDGKTVGDIEIPGKARVCAVIADGIARVADPGFKLAAGDGLVVAVRVDAFATLRDLLED
ncbi:MAG: TrkA family potassium uptake protein [Clostridia bacterium]|nr:TrkA family potassium uptake protein [Clostridia bacterium]